MQQILLMEKAGITRLGITVIFKGLLLIFSFGGTINCASAQIKNPLDTVSKGKRITLKTLGNHLATDLLSQRVVLIGKALANDSPEKDGFLFIPGINKNQVFRVNIAIVSELNAEEFQPYILALYSRNLSEKDLNAVNKVYNSPLAKKAAQFLRNTLIDSNFRDPTYNAFKFDEFA